MRLSVLILRVSTLLRLIITIYLYSFHQRRPDLFSRWQSYALPPSYLGLGLIGCLPLIFSFHIGTAHGQPFSPHSLSVSLVFGYILNNGAFFFRTYQYRFRFCGFHTTSGGWNRCPVLGLLQKPPDRAFFFGRRIIWHPSARPVTEFLCRFLHDRRLPKPQYFSMMQRYNAARRWRYGTLAF